MAYQPAFEPAQVGYLDFETRSPTLDLRQVGAYRYATEAEAIVLSYAIGPDAEPETFAVYDFKSGPLSWARAPDAVKAHHARVMAGEAIWAAWNAGFDRAIWNYSTLDFPEMRPAHIIDVMAQATAAGLPSDLAQASRLAHGAVKLKSGRELIKLFCLPGAEGDPWRHQEEWQHFLDYACADVAALRDLFRRTLQLPAREWEEYFAMEHINERGAKVDLKMVRQAAALAREDRARSAEELYKLTLGAVASVDEVANMVQWLLRVLPADIVSDTLIKRPEEVDDDGNVTRPAKHHLTRKQVRQLIVDVTAALADGEGGPAPGLRDALRLLEIRLYGGSKTPQKFLRIEQQVIDDVLFGQYVFGGAGQTGRASSRGAQVHNLARDTLPYEHQAIEALLAGADYSTMAALGDGAPVSRKLSLLIRPAFIPAPGNLFRLVGLVADRGAHPALAGRRRDAAGYLSRGRCRPEQAGLLHPRRRRLVRHRYFRGDAADPAARQGRRAGARFRWRRQCAAQHGDGLRHASVDRGGGPDRDALAREQPMVRRVLGRGLWCGDCGDAQSRHGVPGRSRDLLLPAALLRRLADLYAAVRAGADLSPDQI